MTWSTPMTATANTAFTAAQFNASVRDNLNETAVAKATTSGQYFVATGANALAARSAGVDSIVATETTASTSFTDIASVGPTVTVTSGTRAVVMVYSRVVNNTGGGISRVGWEVSGATTLAASDNLSLSFESSAASDNLFASACFLYTGLNSGSNTFKMVYKVDAGTGSFGSRRLSIVPL